MQSLETTALGDIPWSRNGLQGDSLVIQGANLSQSSRRALRDASWPCVCKVALPQLPFPCCFFIDNAHTPASVEATAEWFAQEREPKHPSSLVFWPADGRDARALFDRACEGAGRFGTRFDLVLAINTEGYELAKDKRHIHYCPSEKDLNTALQKKRPPQVLFVGSMEASLAAMSYLDSNERAHVVSV